MSYCNKYLKVLLVIVLILSILIFKSINTLSSSNTNNIKTVLVLNSYNLKSNWEALIFEGFNSKLSQYNDIDMKVEFLDSKTQSSNEYKQTFIDLLKIKYSSSNIVAILTVDDEAFNLARANIFNESSIFYRKPLVFIGVNSEYNLTDEESQYISGVIETEDNLRILNLITTLDDNIENIVLLADNAIFSKIVIDNILSIQNLTNKPLNISIIKETNIEDLLHQLPEDDHKTAIIIIGDYEYKVPDKLLSLEDTINLIQTETNIPIYSKIQPYIYAGAIGGVVDWGQYHGKVAAEFIIRLLNGENIGDLPSIYNSLDLTVFNYDSLYKYHINPLKLPKESIIINKDKFDFLLPMYLKVLLWLLIIFTTIGIVTLVILYIVHIRNAKIRKLLFEKALEQEKFKNDFITTMSHEFRTPLNIILSTTHLLDIKCEDNKVDKYYIKNKLQSITHNSNRLLKLINNIIDITKLESGYMTPTFIYNNIVEVIENTVLSTVDFAKIHELEVIFDTEEEEIMTSFDRTKIERCLLNLISNSIKFTPKGGSIYVDIKRENNDIIISVKDSGIGISPDQLKHIFDRFHQVDTSLSRNTEGSGLGLYIVKGLISLHNGTISVESSLGNGTIFTIRLPITTLEESPPTFEIVSDDLTGLVKLELSDLQD